MKRYMYTLLAAVLLVISGPADTAYSHCDTMDGPLVTAALRALAAGNVDPVLAWVPEKDEADIRAAFSKTLEVRKLSPEAKDLADTYFLETLVRIHRAAEGAPYTGIKPHGTPVEPSVDAADKAIETGKIGELIKNMQGAISGEIRKKYNDVMLKKKHMNDSVTAGREYVQSYIRFTHYIEALDRAASAHEHHEE